MHTNIVSDDGLVEESYRHLEAKTRRGLVDRASREFVANRRRRVIP